MDLGSGSRNRGRRACLVLVFGRYPHGYLRGLFVLLNLFRLGSRGTRSRHLVYRSKNHKYDVMHKRTSLELGSELRYVLGRC